jgi:hypothetical protein
MPLARILTASVSGLSILIIRPVSAGCTDHSFSAACTWATLKGGGKLLIVTGALPGAILHVRVGALGSGTLSLSTQALGPCCQSWVCTAPSWPLPQPLLSRSSSAHCTGLRGLNISTTIELPERCSDTHSRAQFCQSSVLRQNVRLNGSKSHHRT